MCLQAAVGIDTLLNDLKSFWNANDLMRTIFLHVWIGWVGVDENSASYRVERRTVAMCDSKAIRSHSPQVLTQNDQFDLSRPQSIRTIGFLFIAHSL